VSSPPTHCGSTVFAGRRWLTPGREELRLARWLRLANNSRRASPRATRERWPAPGPVAHPHGPSWVPPHEKLAPLGLASELVGAPPISRCCQAHKSTVARHCLRAPRSHQAHRSAGVLPKHDCPRARSLEHPPAHIERESADRESVCAQQWRQIDGGLERMRWWSGGGTHVRYFHFIHE
jgi:hypothetical protein